MMNCHNGKIGAARQVFVTALVAPLQWQGGGKPPLAAPALVDTGAQVSCITPALAEALEIPPEGSVSMESASGFSEANTYKVKIHIPLPQSGAKAAPAKISPAQFTPLPVVEYFGGGGIGMLLGMDIIMRGSLEIKGNAFTFCL